MATASRLAVLLFTDIVGSAELKGHIGTAAYATMLERHNRLFESAAAGFGGEVLEHTGDGFFAAFATASDAVRAALQFPSAMRGESWDHPFASRVGIHVGEVATVEMAGKR
jgi:class 3 adenylate cyclase